MVRVAWSITDGQKIHHRKQWYLKKRWYQRNPVNLTPILEPGRQRQEKKMHTPVKRLITPRMSITLVAASVLIKSIYLPLPGNAFLFTRR